MTHSSTERTPFNDFNTNEKINPCAVDDRGRVLQKSFPFSQTKDGFEWLYERLISLLKVHQKTEILVGFEPIGHYWMNLATFLTQHGIPFVMVNPMHVNRTKDLDDNLQTKNDQKDDCLCTRSTIIFIPIHDKETLPKKHLDIFSKIKTSHSRSHVKLSQFQIVVYKC